MTDSPDFERFVLKASSFPGEEGRGYAGNLSWSASKHSLLQFCRRAWYFHYLLAQGGWDRYAAEEHRQAYREKYLIFYDLWLAQIVEKALSNAVYGMCADDTADRGSFLTDAMKQYASQVVFFSYQYLREGGMLTDPRKLSFFEIYYHTGRFSSYEDLMDQTKEDLRHFFLSFPESGMFREILQTESPAWRQAGSFRSFDENGSTVFIRPGLLSLSGGLLTSWQFSFRHSGDYQAEDSLSDKVFSLFRSRKFPGHRARIRKFLISGEDWNEAESFPVPASPYTIRESMNMMTELLQEPVPANFPGREECQEKVCETCRFHGICTDIRSEMPFPDKSDKSDKSDKKKL